VKVAAMGAAAPKTPVLIFANKEDGVGKKSAAKKTDPSEDGDKDDKEDEEGKEDEADAAKEAKAPFKLELNKQSMRSGRMKISDLEKVLQIQILQTKHRVKIKIAGSNGLKGRGIEDGFSWLDSNIKIVKKEKLTVS